MTGERPAIHPLAADPEASGETLGALSAVQLDGIDDVEELGIRIHRREHRAALLDDLRHVHAVTHHGNAKVRHAVEAAGDVGVALAGLDAHRREVDAHHRRRAGPLDADADRRRESGQEWNGRRRMRLLAHHLHRSQKDPVDAVPFRRRAAQNLVQDEDGQIVGADVAEAAAARVRPAERRAHVTDE